MLNIVIYKNLLEQRAWVLTQLVLTVAIRVSKEKKKPPVLSRKEQSLIKYNWQGIQFPKANIKIAKQLKKWGTEQKYTHTHAMVYKLVKAIRANKNEPTSLMKN